MPHLAPTGVFAVPGVVGIGRAHRLAPISHSSTRLRVVQRRNNRQQQHGVGTWRPSPLAVPQRAPYTPLRRPGIAAARRSVIMWFRNDLRLDCNDALLEANRSGSSLLPVYCFDPREFRKSVSDLRQRLRARGSDLIVRVGRPEDVLPALAERIDAGRVFCHAEVNAADVAVESAVHEALQQQGVDVTGHWGCTLHHPEDLPFAVKRVPTSYGAFKDAMQGVRVRPAEGPPEGLLPLPHGGVEPGQLPTLEQLGVEPTKGGVDPHAAGSMMQGGESEALRRLGAFVRDLAPASGSGFSCEIAPWLSCGCVAPRRVFEQLAEQLRGGVTTNGQQPRTHACACVSALQLHVGNGAHTGGQWMQGELLWRDFFRFITYRYTEEATHTAVPA